MRRLYRLCGHRAVSHERIFGPERARLLADLLPATAAGDAARRDKQAARLRRRLARIDNAEHGHTLEMEALATTSGHPQAPQQTSPELPDALPQIPAVLAGLPLRLRRKLYQALDLQLIYRHDTGQVTCRATITDSTPATVAAIIHDSHDPASDTAGTPVRTPAVVSLEPQRSHDHVGGKPGRGAHG